MTDLSSTTNDIATEATTDASLLSMDQVTQIIQKMREEQESFLEQQRETIIQQVLESIQRSGIAAPVLSATRKAVNPSPSTTRLEKNLHTLVHHSLADSGLDFPHVHNTLNKPRTRSAKENGAGGVNTAKKKQIILSRREVEADDSFTDQSASNEEAEEKAPEQGCNREPSTLLSHSPLRSSKAATRKKCYRDSEKRCHPRRKNTNALSPHSNEEDDEYVKFVDPVDSAFNAIRNKVDQRTLAILDRSKTLLGQVKQSPSRIQSSAGKTSFVAKLRQRYAEVEGGADTSPEDASTANPCHASNISGPIGEPLSESTLPTPARENDADEVASESEPTVNTDSTLQFPSEAIRCDLELLQPPENPPENENEWENELARQILAIYATSVKAKALGQVCSESSGNKANGNQQTTEACQKLKKTNEQKQRLRSASNMRSANTRDRSLSNLCSLPAIGRKSASKSNTQQRRIHYSWEPSQRREDGKVIISMPRVPRPIWFAGTGAVKAVWCALADGFSKLRPQQIVADNKTSSVAATSMCDHRLCEEVRRLEAKTKFAQCITTLESLLIALVRARGVGELEIKLWKQLVVTCNAFASRCIDYQKFPAGLQLMKQAEHLIDNSILVDSTMRMELLAYLYDTYAHYYYKRRKAHAGLQYILKAHEIHSRQSSWAHLAKCRLHIANLLSYQIRHTEAMQYMASILEMIEESKLEEAYEEGVGSGSAQKLCLAAVCYNNLAVEQLHLREFEAASVSSANAQRLAKLCLSYSNRWLAQFQATSDCVALAIATLMEDTNADQNTFTNLKTLSVTEQ